MKNLHFWSTAIWTLTADSQISRPQLFVFYQNLKLDELRKVYGCLRLYCWITRFISFRFALFLNALYISLFALLFSSFYFPFVNGQNRLYEELTTVLAIPSVDVKAKLCLPCVFILPATYLRFFAIRVSIVRGYNCSYCFDFSQNLVWGNRFY